MREALHHLPRDEGDLEDSYETCANKIVVGSKSFCMMNVVVSHLLFSEPLLQVNYDRVQCPSVAILDEHLQRKNASG